jgi:4-alpha-glucanotransferase
LISPELLVKDGLLNVNELYTYRQPSKALADYTKAEEVKNDLFAIAYANFIAGKAEQLQTAFTAFCEREKAWLDDFALYASLKKQNGRKPWYEWKDEWKQRNNRALNVFAKKQAEDISKIKWLQFIFDKQWKELKQYCNDRNIQLVGDMPFYVSYDSSDVWANKELFALDEDGNRTGMAGVPPDAFSADGQLWGMPVFKWDAAYWEVPAGETTARNGKWIPAPGKELFQVAEKELGSLPFVAEDLGDIDDTVYEVRDAFHLPGMKVIQFAFGEDIAHTPHIPHNYSKNFLVYTGTHDNNTTRGWYRQEADDGIKKRLEQYVGRFVHDSEIHMQLGRMAYSSVAKIVILPMQDVLGLDETARMNIPASAENNWAWRLIPGQLLRSVEGRLRDWVGMYNR